MKKSIYLLISCFSILLFISGCNNSSKIVNYNSSNVKNIEIYKFSVPSDAEKRIVTDKNDIKTIINDFNHLEIKEVATSLDIAFGGAMTFVFNTSDNTQLIISYDGNTIKTPDGSPNKFWYKIGDHSLFNMWDNLNYPVQKVQQGELPIINKK